MKKYNKLFILTAVIGAFMFSCKTQKSAQEPLTNKEKKYINRILKYGLDHEALYTILADIKPMSSLRILSLPVVNTDSISGKKDAVPAEKLRHLDSLKQIQTTLNKINIPDVKFVAIPYKATKEDKLSIQVSAVRLSLLNKVLEDKKSFFGQFGLVHGSSPELVVSTIENAKIYDRYRGYGYLFGYPDYAVDFFVEAAKETNKNKKLYPRKFFQIPVFSSKNGYFVYAYSESYTPSKQVDSTLYYKADFTLKEYRKLRPKFMNPDSTMNALELINAYNKGSR